MPRRRPKILIWELHNNSLSLSLPKQTLQNLQITPPRDYATSMLDLATFQTLLATLFLKGPQAMTQRSTKHLQSLIHQLLIMSLPSPPIADWKAKNPNLPICFYWKSAKLKPNKGVKPRTSSCCVGLYLLDPASQSCSCPSGLQRPGPQRVSMLEETRSKVTRMKDNIDMNTSNHWARAASTRLNENTDIQSALSLPHPPSVYREMRIHPAQVGPSFPSPSFQKADQWKTWCFSSYWTCGENLGCCWSCCHLPRDWKVQRNLLRVKSWRKFSTVAFEKTQCTSCLTCETPGGRLASHLDGWGSSCPVAAREGWREAWSRGERGTGRLLCCSENVKCERKSWKPLIPRSLEPVLSVISENCTAWHYPLLPPRKQTNSGQKHHIPPYKISLLGWDLMS